MAEGTHYYLDDFTDEVNPAGPTLESWAAWLFDPSGNPWGGFSGAKHGDHFAAHRMEVSDVVATWREGSWVHTGAPADATFFAMRYGKGWGWEVDSISDTLDGALLYAADLEPEEGEEVFIACGRDLPKVQLEFRVENGVPALVQLGTVQ